MPQGAQTVRPAPVGTIPPPVKPFSDRPDSAKSKMLERMKARSTPQKAGDVTPPTDTKKPVTEVTKPPATPEVPDPEPQDKPDDENLLDEDITTPMAEQKKEEGKSPVDEGKTTPEDPKNPKAKINPWKLADEHKAARAQLEKELVELKKLVPNTEARKAEMAEIEAIKKRNEELEQHIKYAEFKESKEYKDTYEKPYVDQWKQSMQTLHGLTVMDDEGGARNVEPADILQVVNEPSAILARKKAIEMFGEEYAQDVMTERDKIVTLHNKRVAAEDQARKEGSERFNKLSKAHQEAYEKLNSEVGDTYQRAVLSIKSNPANKEFFDNIEGDEEANVKLAKGYELVDQAFKQNPMDPTLTSEQRKSITKLHAAIRHRAAGFGRAKYLLVKERARSAELEKKLAQYENTVPNRGPAPSTSSAPVNGGGSKMSAMQQRLRARAHPARG